MSLWKRAPRSDEAVAGRIRQVLVEMRPMLHFDAVGIELVQFDGATGVVILRISGDCPDCDMDAAMLRQGIEAHLRLKVPEISAVRAV